MQYVNPVTSDIEATCSVTASQPGNAQFLAAPSVTQSFKWIKEDTTITATFAGKVSIDGTNLDSIVQSATRGLQAGNSAGTKALNYTSLTPGICRVTDVTYPYIESIHTRGVVRAVANGTCKVQIDFNGNGYWIASSVIASAVISDVITTQPGSNTAQSITFPAIADREYGAGYQLNAKASSGLPITYASATPTNCKILNLGGGKYAVQSNPGLSSDNLPCSVTASQPGDDRFAAATSVTQSFKWMQSAMSIKVTNPTGTRVAAGQYQLTASLLHTNTALNSGLKSIGHLLAAISTTPTVCQVMSTNLLDSAGGIFTQAKIKVTGIGTCTTTWNFAGSGTRKAVSTFHSFAVNRLN